MGKNIFEGAKFGDKFLTKNGKIAILIYLYNETLAKFVIEDSCYKNPIVYIRIPYGVNEDWMIGDCYNIVSRYQEPIDEEELDKLAMDFYLSQTMLVGKQYRKHVMDIFKAAYRKINDEK